MLWLRHPKVICHGTSDSAVYLGGKPVTQQAEVAATTAFALLYNDATREDPHLKNTVFGLGWTDYCGNERTET